MTVLPFTDRSAPSIRNDASDHDPRAEQQAAVANLSAICELMRLAFRSVDDATLARAREIIIECLRVRDAKFIADGEDTIEATATAVVATPTERYGVLAVFGSSQRRFSVEERVFLQAIANILAEAMDRQRAARQLAASEERYREVVEGASEIIFSLAMDGTIRTMNAAFEQLTGFHRADWIGKPYIELIHPDDRAHSAGVFRAIAERHETVHDTLRIVAKGCIKTVELTSFAKIEGGRITAIYGFARDITEAKRVESERIRLEGKLAQAERLTSLGRLAATVAHEFNNILMGIASFTEMIRRGKNVPTAVDHITQSIGRGKRITSDILRFTQHAEPVRAPFDVAPWLESIGVEARSLMPANCEVALDIEDRTLRVDGDTNQLQQVFTNLVLNARDAMPEGGKLTISIGVARARARVPLAVIEAPETFAHFTIRDTGCGISPESLAHVFEPLFTTKKNGTGLGLSVVHQVVMRHGGEIFAESTPGAGTAFHIFLPLTSRETAPVEVAPPPQADAPPASRLLLVEDDPAIGEGLCDLLAMDHIDVVLATTGAEAIRAVHGGKFDVVLLDVGLPDIDGLHVYEAIAAMHPDLPVIFSTGHGDRWKIDALKSRPDVAFLLKPYDTAALMTTMREVVEKVSRPPSLPAS